MADAVAALCVLQGPVAGTPTDQAEGSVAEQLGRVVQLLADLGADAEGRRRRPVPRPPEPASLADQLTVMSTDLLAAEAQASSTALLGALTERLDALREAL